MTTIKKCKIDFGTIRPRSANVFIQKTINGYYRFALVAWNDKGFPKTLADYRSPDEEAIVGMYFMYCITLKIIRVFMFPVWLVKDILNFVVCKKRGL